jgi:hypothetical protein
MNSDLEPTPAKEKSERHNICTLVLDALSGNYKFRQMPRGPQMTRTSLILLGLAIFSHHTD